MSGKLSKNILQDMRKRVKTTPLRDLKRRGLNNVSVLDLSDLNLLIQQAVDRTLGELGIKLSPRDLKTQNDRVREEFLRIVKEKDSLQESKDLLEKELQELKQNYRLGAARVEVERKILVKEEKREIAKEAVTFTPEQIDSIRATLTEKLKKLLKDAGVDKKLAEEAVGMTLELIEAERQRAFDEAKASQDNRIRQLKRRISKLVSKLDETEQMLAQIELAGPMDEGIASIFRTVQGLKDGVNYYEEKKTALKKIFNLNLELKKLINDS